jgi:N-acetylmuramoyl-L-alanine amidase
MARSGSAVLLVARDPTCKVGEMRHLRRWGWNAAVGILAVALGGSVAAVETSVASVGVAPEEIAAEAAPTPAPGPRRGHGKLVVLDPGHGGSNAGAASVVAGVSEKLLTMRLARAVKERLEARGIEVQLTREVDEYMSLRQRVAFANRAAADLFLSIHFNATEAHSQRGFETWILTPRALDIDSRALRADEGAARDADRETALLLDDIERGMSQPAAADLAASIQSQLAARFGRDRDRGVRQSAMDVLLGATMPAALVEVGFIDHPIEGHELLDPAVQSVIADALADGIAARL